jgi:5-methylcytosine-specific restriction endonuclease McrA
MPADPKPRRRIRARDARSRLAAYGHVANHPCVVCGERRAVQAAHVVPRSQGGDDVRENIAPLCWECHPLLDQGATKEAAMVRRAFRWWIESEPDVLAYVIRRKGLPWLTERYPLVWPKPTGAEQDALDRRYPAR